MAARPLPTTRPPTPPPSSSGPSSAGASAPSGTGGGGASFLSRAGERLRGGPGGAALLVLATVVALVWANLPGGTYQALWGTELGLSAGDAELTLSLRHWVNDGLMAFFFFVIGLEVKRELVVGRLADRRRAAVPAAAALVGLVVPALVYVAFTAGTPAVGAWGVVISTDTAFVVGVLALLGSRCPPQLRLFLLALAIADDVGALTVIALFYTDDLALVPLAVAVGGLALMLGLRRLQVWRGPAYLVVAAVSWVALYLSGVHATLLGVVVALMTPAYRARRDEVGAAERRTRAYLQSPDAESALAARLSIDRSVPVGERLHRLWEPWTTVVVVPLFALGNAGVVLSGETLSAAATSPVTLGVVAGLVLGKLLGVWLGAELAVHLRLGVLAPELHRLHVLGGAGLTGIGFTISLLIVDLALPDDGTAAQARVGVLTASVVAAALGSALLRLAARRHPAAPGEDQQVLDPPVDPERDHVRGPVDAPLVLVEYGDFECPFCGQATGSVEEVRARLGDRVQYVFRHLPKRAEHPHAQLAAEAAEAAGAQGRYWDMHDRLFAHPDRLEGVHLVEHAGALGLDLSRFTRDLGEHRAARRVEQDVASAEAGGVSATPTFFVGGRRHTGPYDAETLVVALERSAGTQAAGPVRGRLARAVPRRDPADVPLPAPDAPETDEDDASPRLSRAQTDHLARHARRRPVSRGEVLFTSGEVVGELVVVSEGAVAVVDDEAGGSRPRTTVHGAGRFLGEMDVLSARPTTRSAVVVRDGEVLLLDEGARRAALGTDKALQDLVLRTLMLRRALVLEESPDLRVFVRVGSGDGERLRDVASRHGLTAEVVELGEQELDSLREGLAAQQIQLPKVVLRRGDVLSGTTEEHLESVLAGGGPAADGPP